MIGWLISVEKEHEFIYLISTLTQDKKGICFACCRLFSKVLKADGMHVKKHTTNPN